MGFIILNIINEATIDNLNARFNKHYIKTLPIETIITTPDYRDSQFYRTKKFMEANREVSYECSKGIY